ncbi:hypothetical protein P154DRAFT_536112 [Amniculicola lignicola CBS 123094]|uniref:Uncharacterized protein n=1 Tax=Amniculicola lignicola CBS 123094 TaxID=1392246 RepID=A0A6A5WAV2_9PLEO|nr:hypothetical protein P154DRAFT_536112 [Amniculicola lignicola CBS 123094]
MAMDMRVPDGGGTGEVVEAGDADDGLHKSDPVLHRRVPTSQVVSPVDDLLMDNGISLKAVMTKSAPRATLLQDRRVKGICFVCCSPGSVDTYKNVETQDRSLPVTLQTIYQLTDLITTPPDSTLRFAHVPVAVCGRYCDGVVIYSWDPFPATA